MTSQETCIDNASLLDLGTYNAIWQTYRDLLSNGCPDAAVARLVAVLLGHDVSFRGQKQDVDAGHRALSLLEDIKPFVTSDGSERKSHSMPVTKAALWNRILEDMDLLSFTILSERVNRLLRSAELTADEQKEFKRSVTNWLKSDDPEFWSRLGSVLRSRALERCNQFILSRIAIAVLANAPEQAVVLMAREQHGTHATMSDAHGGIANEATRDALARAQDGIR